jgi:hypothetical protein
MKVSAFVLGDWSGSVFRLEAWSWLVTSSVRWCRKVRLVE